MKANKKESRSSMNYKKFSLALLLAFSAVTASHASINSVLDSINQKVSILGKIRSTVNTILGIDEEILDIVKSINEKQECTYEIKASDIGTSGFVIDKPGTWCLVDDVVFDPVSPAGSAAVAFTGGGGSGAAGLAVVSDGIVRGVLVANGGSGYTSAPGITITGAGSGATAVSSIGVVTSITIDNGGSGYLTPPSVSIAQTVPAPGATNANIRAIARAEIDSNGTVIAIILVNPGSGYTGTTASVTFNNTGTGGSGAAATATVAPDVVGGIQVISAGSGYPETVQAAITIASSDVDLRLGGHRLIQAGVDDEGNVSSTQKPFVVGILVPDVLPTSTNVNDVGLESIQIIGEDGLIDGFSMFGIRIFGHTEDIQVADLTIQNCGKLASPAIRPSSGYQVSSSPPSPYVPVRFTVGAMAIGEDSVFGMGSRFFTPQTQNEFVPSAQNIANNIEINNVSCLDNYYSALLIPTANNVYITNCHFDRTFAEGPVNNSQTIVQLGKIFTIGSGSINNLTMENSTINNSIVLGDFINKLGRNLSAIVMGFVTNGTIENCEVNGYNSQHPGHTALVWFLLSTTNVTLRNCSVKGVQTLSADTELFAMQSNANLNLINCIAESSASNGQLVIGAPTRRNVLIGFNLGIIGITNAYLENCLTSNIIMNGPSDVKSFACGFLTQSGAFTEPFGQNIVYNDCIASRIQAVQGGAAGGFVFRNARTNADLRTVILESCIAEGCESLIPTLIGRIAGQVPVQGTAQGFFFARTADAGVGAGFPISYTNCKALRNRGIPGPRIDEGFGANTFARTYSAGFFALGNSLANPAQKHTYFNCESEGNIYGFIFQNVRDFVIRNCQSDNNLADDGITGEGFTDVGLSLTATPTIVTPTASLFEFNHAFNNGLGTDFVGTNQNYNVVVTGTALPTPLPTFRGKISTSLPYTFFDPVVVSSPVHNISMIK